MSLPTPNTRKEQYLNAIATGNAGGLPTPITREEEYLDAIAKGGGSGDGDMKKSVYDSDLDVAGAGGIKAFVNDAISGKVDKVEGKGLSTNDYTNEDKAIVDSVTGALATKQDVLTFDDEPTANSNNPVKSGGIFDAVNTSPKTIEGNPVTFSDGIDLPARNVIVTIEPSQEGTGDPSPTNVRPLIGFDEVDVEVCGKNLIEETINATIDSTGTVIGPAQDWKLHIAKVIKGVTYTIKSSELFVGGFFISKPSMGSVTYDGSRWADTPVTFIAPITGYVAFRSSSNYTTPQIEVGSQSTSYEPYNPNSKTTTVQLGRTVYGGVLDVTNGKLTLTHGFSDLKTANWSYSDGIFSTNLGDSKTYQSGNLPNMFCSICPTGIYSIRASYSTITAFMVDTLREFQIRYSGYTSVEDFVAFLTSNNAQLAYELATPEVIDLTPTEIDMLLGYNTIFTNGTTLSLIYQPNNVLGVAEKYTDDKVKMAMSEITCQETTEGDYTLKATVDENGKVTYEWVAVTP